MLAVKGVLRCSATDRASSVGGSCSWLTPPRLHFSSHLETAFSPVGVQESLRIGRLQVPPRCAVRCLALPPGAARPHCDAAARDRASAHATLRRLVLRLRLRLSRQHAVLLVVLQLLVYGGQRGVCSRSTTAGAVGDERGARGTDDYDSFHMTWALKSKQPCSKVRSLHPTARVRVAELKSVRSGDLGTLRYPACPLHATCCNCCRTAPFLPRYNQHLQAFSAYLPQPALLSLQLNHSMLTKHTYACTAA